MKPHTFACMKYGLVLLFFIAAACGTKEMPNEAPNKFSDPQLVKIYSYQNERNVDALIPFLKAKKEEHRVQAALAFASIQSDTIIPFLAQMLLIDQDELPRRAAAHALGQIGSDKAAKVLRQAFASEITKENQRVVLEAIGKCMDSSSLTFLTNFDPQDELLQLGWLYGVYRAMYNKWTNDSIYNRVITSLSTDKSEEYQVMAANFVMLQHKRTPMKDTLRVQEKLKTELVPEALRFLEMALELPSHEQLQFSTSLKDSLEGSSLSTQLDILSKLADGAETEALLVAMIKDDQEHPLLRDQSMLRLTELAKTNFFKGSTALEETVAHIIRNESDMALQSLACYALADKSAPQAWGKVKVEDLEKRMAELELPRELETYLDYQRAIENWTQEELERPKFEQYKSVDWDYIQQIPAEQKVLIKTSKGDIVIRLFVEDAPTSVANFLRLVDSGFYNGKIFHRVVPNFVIQGGCPRGDGWGSLDWIQRSEFSNYQHYSKGTVGLASAGKDTEGVQWFITHCATPFLTGRYTIFARVESGMDVVDVVEIGDKIISVERITEQSH